MNAVTVSKRLMLSAGLATILVVPSSCKHIEIHNNLMPEAKLFSFHTGEDSGYMSVYYLVTEHGANVFDVPSAPVDVQNLGYDIRINCAHNLEGIYLTSALPERYVGASTLASETGAEILASEGTALLMEEQDGAYLDAWNLPGMDAQESQVIMEPHQVFKAGERHKIDGVKMSLIGSGAGPTAGMTAIYLPQLDTLIPGPMVFSEVHPVMKGNRSDVWIASLEELGELGAEQVMPGTGNPGGPELIQSSILYLRTMQDMVANWEPKGRQLTDQLSDNIAISMIEAFPEYRYRDALPISITDEWIRQGGLFNNELPQEMNELPAQSEAIPIEGSSPDPDSQASTAVN